MIAGASRNGWHRSKRGMNQSSLSLEDVDYRFNKCLRKAMNDMRQLVKGEISEDELDVEQGFQQLAVGTMIENFTKILLDNEKVDYADVNVEMRLKNIRYNSRKQNNHFFSYRSKGLDERGGRIMRN